MSWSNKETASHFDTTALPGLQFLHGDVLSERYHQDRLANQKYPLVQFPSGVARELRVRNNRQPEIDVHIFGQLYLPYHLNAGSAYGVASMLAPALDIQVFHNFEDEVIVMNGEGNQGHVLLFDNHAPHLKDIVLTPGWGMELLDGDRRAILPPLYSTEKQGLNAIAPIKFFTPDANWTWYPTEFDGKDVFFGLVSGFEVELGFFSLSELEGVRGALGLPIERDLYFEPTPLKKLKQQHQS